MTSTSQKKHRTTRLQYKKILSVVAAIILIAAYLYLTKDQSSNVQIGQEHTTSSDNTTIPQFAGRAYEEVNGNIPFFTKEEITEAKQTGSYERYGDLDSLGRCTAAMDNLSEDTMPDYGEKRESISEIHPTGWVQAKYDCVDSQTVMTRTHLVGWMLSAENANKKNLITGTRYMNSDAMTVFELQTVRYIERGTDRHVLYRVTPVYEGSNLMASGVLMEGYSLEDNGKGICFCVFIYNVQPGIVFDYSTGKSAYSGIFYDIYADSVVTNGISLDDYVITDGVIHKKDCQKADGGVAFKGDTAMENKWSQFGYSLCECVG